MSGKAAWRTATRRFFVRLVHLVAIVSPQTTRVSVRAAVWLEMLAAKVDASAAASSSFSVRALAIPGDSLVKA